MKIKTLSIKTVTVAIFVMIGIVAIVLSLLAGSYFRQSALDAQMHSLTRVIEVASEEMQHRLRQRSFDLGSKLAHSKKLVKVFNAVIHNAPTDQLINQLNDPIVNGFVGFSEINLVKLRVYDLELNFIAESSAGTSGIEQQLPSYLIELISARPKQDRLKGVDALWLTSVGPLHSSVIPLGGLRPVGFLEVIVDPLFNLEAIANITQTPVSFYAMTGELLNTVNHNNAEEYLPVEYLLNTSDGQPAFRIVGLENVEELNQEMARIRTVTVSGFLLLVLATLLLAMWLFSRFMLSPVDAMVKNMRKVTQGKFDPVENSTALREFHELTTAFNTMASQVRTRTNDLERLLDLDESAILCLDKDNEIVFFNRSAASHFGYTSEEINDLDLADLFVDDIALMAKKIEAHADGKMNTTLECRCKNGQTLNCDVVINTLDVMGQQGHAIALREKTENTANSEQSEQRQDAVEQSLASLLEFAKNNPSLVLGLGNLGEAADGEASVDKTQLRQQAVSIMSISLAIWESELGKSKLSLAEQSGIWPVYIDKSTPTTRTLDKYLSLESCPKNPRSKRVIDTAEFVLHKLPDDCVTAQETLQTSLDVYRTLLSGVIPVKN
ncbi:MAG: PAS domain-containing protein [Methylococcales bacterium]